MGYVFCLQPVNSLILFPPMTTPGLFLKRLKKAFAGRSLPLREVARRVEVSPAYISCLLRGERNAPDNAIIARLEEVLDVQPRGALFDGAGRHDPVASNVFKNDKARLLMRSLEPLTDKEFARVLEVAQSLAEKHKQRQK